MQKEDGMSKVFCKDCLFFERKLTDSGRKHPSGDGTCGYKYVPAPIPAMMYATSYQRVHKIVIRKDSPSVECLYYKETAISKTMKAKGAK
jgi:hypothetical protein